jgi:hypothetical protein
VRGGGRRPGARHATLPATDGGEPKGDPRQPPAAAGLHCLVSVVVVVMLLLLQEMSRIGSKRMYPTEADPQIRIEWAALCRKKNE